MSRYNFVSGGAAAGDAIEAFFLRQAEEERRRLLDAQAKQEAEAQIRQRDEQLGLTRRAQDLADQQRADALGSLQEERDFRRASTVADTMVPGIVDADTSSLLQKHGFGGLVEHVDVPGTPGVMDTSGGFKWRQAREQEQARAESAAASAQAAAERAAADREARAAQAAQTDETRRLIATMNSQNASSNRALQDEATRARIEATNARTAADNEKRAAADKEKADAERAKSEARSYIASLANDLANDPQLTDISGSMFNGSWREWVPGNAEAARKYNELLAKMALEKRGDLKGQGQVSNYETQLVERGTGLSRNVPTAALQKKLLEIAQQYGGAPAATASAQRPRILSITPLP